MFEWLRRLAERPRCSAKLVTPTAIGRITSPCVKRAGHWFKHKTVRGARFA